jgi:hypothetical protein
MFRQYMALVALLPAVCSLGALIGFFISTGRALKKFSGLDAAVQGKLLLLEYYMAAVRNLSSEELALLGKLPDEEIKYFNTIYDYAERIGAIRDKIGALSKTKPGP